MPIVDSKQLPRLCAAHAGQRGPERFGGASTHNHTAALNYGPLLNYSVGSMNAAPERRMQCEDVHVERSRRGRDASEKEEPWAESLRRLGSNDSVVLAQVARRQ